MERSSKPSTSRIGRTYRLARLATDTSARFALGMAKRAVGGDGDVDEPHLPRDIEDHRKIAAKATRILGGMKGLAMKAGQIVSYVDDWIPEEVRPVYQEMLTKLQAQAPVVPLAEMLNVFIAEVGEPPDEVFRNFEEEPIAAASIGQVYRAELPTGEPVAVKIQYPGIDQVIQSDIKNLKLLESVIKASTMGRVDAGGSLHDIKLKITEELDYRVEADNQERFRTIYADHPRIVVPRVHREFSHQRVLTSELLEGQTYYEFRDSADQDAINGAAEVLYEFVFGSFHRHGLFNADPHPGNYLFLPDGRVGFLDFGCVQDFPLEVPHRFRVLIERWWEEDPVAVREGLPAALGYPGAASDEEKDFFFDYVTYLWRPTQRDQPFRYTEDYTREVYKRTYSGVRLGAKVALTRGYPDTEHRGLALLNRLQFGFASILGGLKAEANWQQLMRSFFAHADALEEQAGTSRQAAIGHPQSAGTEAEG